MQPQMPAAVVFAEDDFAIAARDGIGGAEAPLVHIATL
jgi:hypothetical protein